MTKTLIEQWQKGKLPNGDYYIKVCGNLTGKEFFVYDNYINGKWKYTLDRNVIDIIAPVPSCKEYIKLISKIEQLEKKLDITTKALKDIINDGDDYWDKDKAQKALTKMKGVK